MTNHCSKGYQNNCFQIHFLFDSFHSSKTKIKKVLREICNLYHKCGVQKKCDVLIEMSLKIIFSFSTQMALESKRSKLEEQTREAEFLHQNTDRRRRVIRKMLAKYLNDVELEQVEPVDHIWPALCDCATRVLIHSVSWIWARWICLRRFDLRLEPIYTTIPTASKEIKSVQNQLKKVHLTSFI